MGRETKSVLGQNFTPTSREKLLKVMRLLSSDQLGERAAAAHTAHNLAVTFGGWDAVIAPPVDTDHAQLITAESLAEFLTDWDRKFLAGIGATLRTGGKISDRQKRQLSRIILEAKARAA